MLYLIHYDRASAKLLSSQEYEDAERATALNDRQTLELEHNIFNGNQEVVLLQAKNRDQLRSTHPKYNIPRTTGEELLTAKVIISLTAAVITGGATIGPI